MSGIAGWVDYQRDLSREQATVRAMTATMACRGPDAEDVWVSPNAVLGHRALRLDAEHTAQPFVLAEGGRTIAVAGLTGEIYNAAALRAELKAAGHHFRGESPVEVVLCAYLEWGADCAVHLAGAYGISVWDARDETLTLIRDRIGNKPLFYHPTARGMVFGSERKAILANPLVDSVVDLDGLREILSYAGTPGHGVFRGMHQVRPGHFLRVHRDGFREHQYWALEATEHTDDLDTTISTVRELIDDSLTAQLGADVQPSMMLSGGLDSSGLTALAANVLAKRGDGPLHTYTVAFAKEGEFEADEVWGTEDGPFVQELVQKVGAEHTDIVLSTADLLDPVVKVNSLRAKDVPSPLGNMNTSLYVLCRAIRERTPVAMLGDAADGVFGGTMWMSMEPLLKAPTFPWVAMAHWGGGQHGMGTDLVDAGLLGKLDMRGYCGDRYAESMSRVPKLAGESEHDRRMREVWYLNVTNWLETLLPHGESIAQSVGLEFRLPYCDHRLVQYVFNAPWSAKTFDGREKSLLRAALKDVLPESILERRKSPYPVPQDESYAKAICAELAELVADRNAPVAPLVDVAAARRVIDDPASLVAGPRGWVARTHVEMLFQLNLWLDLYGVRVDV
ncbi:asparagine synthase (glutamine-hydrolyzing) [Amycolatopsis nigrescens]|uniref:asparagine synthase (glutamine-hydrolyzing) n=1 Tax=Amycolatopsis nigrescens TaxID=381445 RepID=UPI00035EF181|nr:asparagine synthase (glutamine-hydrolyzing) [Amycolatopsis nigrescens]